MEPVKQDRWREGGARTFSALADLKVKVAEHLISQDCCHPDEMHSILAETKVGARKKADLMEKLRVVFSVF